MASHSANYSQPASSMQAAYLSSSSLYPSLVLPESATTVLDSALALMTFESRSPVIKDGTFPCELTVLSPARYAECWLLPRTDIVHGSDGEVFWSQSGHFMMTGVSVNLDGDVVSQTAAVYQQLLSVISASEHPHLLRFWNYMPRINQGVGDDELYKQFCTGRLQAFERLGVDEHQFPAATAVGHQGRELTIVALTSSIQGVHHGNKNQVHAFDYPRQYGISSPSFARATSVNVDGRELLFVSGTASIAGHLTHHHGDLQGQISLTAENIGYMLSQAQKSLQDIVGLRVYLRDPQLLDEASQWVDRLLPYGRRLYLQADICRADLMIEIECFCG